MQSARTYVQYLSYTNLVLVFYQRFSNIQGVKVTVGLLAHGAPVEGPWRVWAMPRSYLHFGL